MRTTYNKLVRDRIPEIIKADGKFCHVEVMPDEQYRLALAEKLVEESKEAATAARAGNKTDLMRELADIYEVIDGLMVSYALDRDAVLELKLSRELERGAFKEKLQLVWVESDRPQ